MSEVKVYNFIKEIQFKPEMYHNVLEFVLKSDFDRVSKELEECKASKNRVGDAAFNTNDLLLNEIERLKAENKAIKKDNFNLEHGLKHEASIRESIQDRLKSQVENNQSLQEKLKIAKEALKTIHIGVDPRNGEWSEQFQDTMLKAFTAKTASDYANETLKQLEEM